MNAEFEKILSGSHKLPQAHEKVCDENERRKRRRRVPIIFLMEGITL